MAYHGGKRDNIARQQHGARSVKKSIKQCQRGGVFRIAPSRIAQQRVSVSANA